ncbi:aspartate 4-decarboxylase [Desulfosporosinus orientis DSM 765]|uniref:Aminotransferase n=1 Tax=Desulfosporosinus orientis (strain ATCC 19365 / DSM 765 / NCIMB 8382 / VKM B-1628 / Singapore I) TaxID=768706 RepID=G7WFX5_DESOD|nr:aspartate 4-decarboxylase [Desulfosporosinus orientis]AET69490.1 aspartate 4-decarboxylase [Desulfosporosinus orientis DSM 765]
MITISNNTILSKKEENSYEHLSPFELKDKLISLANKHGDTSIWSMLNAGRGNPNWIAAAPRDAFFTLGQFAVTEASKVWQEKDLAGMPHTEGIANRFTAFLDNNPDAPGTNLLRESIAYGITHLGFEADAWVHELVDGIIGDNYPVPDRMLVHLEQVVHAYLIQEMCNHTPPPGRYDLFAVEGGTAAMCYIFDSLIANKLLSVGDKIALMVPTFTPYLEIPHLARYNFEIVRINALEVDKSGIHTWQYTEDEVAKLADPCIKALYVVNPSNPPSVAIRDTSKEQLIDIVYNHNPNLMIITDDVYGTFVDNFRSLMAELPYNTLGVYSFSKYFGATGWRLGVIALHQNNVFDHLLQNLPPDKAEALSKRYGTITFHPEKLSFINRMVADSRQVALNHTAGLSTPQQVQMGLFALFALLDKENHYKELTQEICHRRQKLLFEGLGLDLHTDKFDASYYNQIDLLVWAKAKYGPEFCEYLQANYEPTDFLFRLAKESSIVLLNGSGFGGPKWSIRTSLANLDDAAYQKIGETVHKTFEEYASAWRASKKPKS